MAFHWLLKLSLSAICSGISRATPTGCHEDDHCRAGYFCNVNLFCQKCLKCEDLMRGPAASKSRTSCITSVTECGGCLSGLVPDTASNECVSSETGGLGSLLPYEWAIIVIALIVALIICVAAAYVLKNFNTLKIRASTRTSVHSRAESQTVAASAPPPPYETVDILPTLENTEELKPFIRPISPRRSGKEYESANIQNARVFNNPTYVRTLQPMSSESPANETILSTIQEDNDNNIELENNSDNAAAMTTSSDVQTVQSPKNTSKDRQDSNNNRASDCEDHSRAILTQNATSIVINVIKHGDTVQQTNEMNF